MTWRDSAREAFWALLLGASVTVRIVVEKIRDR
jgi:hypothetical protein